MLEEFLRARDVLIQAYLANQVGQSCKFCRALLVLKLAEDELGMFGWRLRLPSHMHGYTSNQYSDRSSQASGVRYTFPRDLFQCASVPPVLCVGAWCHKNSLLPPLGTLEFSPLMRTSTNDITDIDMFELAGE